MSETGSDFKHSHGNLRSSGNIDDAELHYPASGSLFSVFSLLGMCIVDGILP